MAGRKASIHPAFHADLRILDEPGRALVRADYAAPDPTRLLRQRQDSVAKIEAFVAAYNVKAKPFQWTATSDAIFAKLERLCKAINGTAH